MLEDIIKERKKKLDRLVKAGLNPYPSKVKRTHLISDILTDFQSFSKNQKKIFICGRIRGLRDQGKIIFYDLVDESGKIQAVLKRENNPKIFNLFKENLDIGDFVEIGGLAFITKKGEKSVEIKNPRIIVKSLKPLPSQWYGLADIEERYRKRYLDIILNPEVKEKIVKRFQVIQYLRDKLLQEGFLEVETPILQAVPGGAKARPFVTHHNALDSDFYLRIAPELYLKRLLVAGFEKVFEIGRNFRNEGIDRDHNPEFTMLELYWAYQDWQGLMKFIEKILKKYIPGKWQKFTFEEAIKKYAKKDLKNIAIGDLDEVFKSEVRLKLIKPTFITHYPKSISPLAKSLEENPEFTERFQLIVEGMEVVNGFSELNNPLEQRERMERQEKMYRAGDLEESRLDEDFLTALEHGMPPSAGVGIGIDRLAAYIAKAGNIKEIIIFPTLKLKKE
ncbi:MAG: amino acid--tRNA ligase-related protein [Patescibacteria group bacterium]